MSNQVTVASELKRRMDLVNCAKFRSFAAEASKKLGVTSKEWNENRAAILMMMANQVCSIENKVS